MATLRQLKQVAREHGMVLSVLPRDSRGGVVFDIVLTGPSVNVRDLDQDLEQAIWKAGRILKANTPPVSK